MAATFDIRVSGTSSAFHRAERALLHLSAASNQLSSPAKASEAVAAAANQIREMISPYCLQDATTGQTLPNSAITHYTMSTLDTTSHQPRIHARDVQEMHNFHTGVNTNSSSGSTNPGVLYSAKADMIIKFADFDVLGKLATQFSAMDNIKISKIEWKLTDHTLDSLKSGTRKKAAQDALARAYDYAEIFGGHSSAGSGGEGDTDTAAAAAVAANVRRSVRAKTINENAFYQESTRPHLQMGKLQRARGLQRVDTQDLFFEPEDVKLDVTCNAEFVVSFAR